MHGRARNVSNGRIYRDPATGRLRCTCCQNLLCCSSTGVAMGLVGTPWRCKFIMRGTLTINFSGGASSSSLPTTAFDVQDTVSVPATTRCGGSPQKTWTIATANGTLRLEAQGWVDQFTGTATAPTCAGGGGSIGPGSSQPWVNPGFSVGHITSIPGGFSAGATIGMAHKFAVGASPSNTIHGPNRWNGGLPMMRMLGCTSVGTYTYTATPFLDLPTGPNFRKFGFNSGGVSWDRRPGAEQLIVTIEEFSAELLDHFSCSGADFEDFGDGEALMAGIPEGAMAGANFGCTGCGG
jgi:hypothetical protein